MFRSLESYRTNKHYTVEGIASCSLAWNRGEWPELFLVAVREVGSINIIALYDFEGELVWGN